MVTENVKWLELIQKKKDGLVKVGIDAYRYSIYNPNLVYIVELDEDGNVYLQWEKVGNCCTSGTSFCGNYIEVCRICNRNWKKTWRICDEQVINKLWVHDYGKNRINELCDEADACNQSVITTLKDCDTKMFGVVYKELKDEYIEWMVCEYGYATIMRGIAEAIDIFC
jgi:hypothetical protein